MGSLREDKQIERFIAQPFGAYVASTNFISWCRDPSLSGTITFDQIDRRELTHLTATLAFNRHPKITRHACLTDMRHLVVIDPTPFLVIDAYVKSRLDFLTQIMWTQAIILPEDPFSQTLVRGYFEATAIIPSKCFIGAEAALAHVGAPAALGAELDALYQQHGAASANIRALRRVLANAYATADLQEVAHTLGLSPRVLQRSLSEAGTSFTDELSAIRLSTAEALLRTTDDKVATIAESVGYASAAHFGRVFKREYNMTPDAWRTTHR